MVRSEIVGGMNRSCEDCAVKPMYLQVLYYAVGEELTWN